MVEEMQDFLILLKHPTRVSVKLFENMINYSFHITEQQK